MILDTNVKIKPFVKWVGGKTQLLSDIINIIPDNIETYIEPFVGGGAVLSVLFNNPNIKHFYINDLNTELMNCYKVIKDNVDGLIQYLSMYKEQFNACKSEEERSTMYYRLRTEFNMGITLWSNNIVGDIHMAALLIFLNKTGFNGLYRVNKSGKFNVPFNHCKNITLYDKNNLLMWHDYLQQVELSSVSYEKIIPNDIEYNTAFYYLDPPYKPITKTSAFTAYSKENFYDADQEQLKQFCDLLDSKNCKFLQSNSEPGTGYFNTLYKNYTIDHVKARRSINSNGNKRGKIDEILIYNY